MRAPVHSMLLAGFLGVLQPTLSGQAPALVCQKSQCEVRETLWKAVRLAAARSGVALSSVAGPESLEWYAPAPLLREVSSAEVQDVTIDPFLHSARFRLRITHEPQAPSFFAWCPLEDATPARTSWWRLADNSATVRTDIGPIAVDPRRWATLQLHSQNSFASLRIRPLQCGIVGQAIRVRVPGNGHTLRARVVGIDLVEADF